MSFLEQVDCAVIKVTEKQAKLDSMLSDMGIDDLDEVNSLRYEIYVMEQDIDRALHWMETV